MAKAKVTPPIDDSVLGGGVVNENNTQKEKRDLEGKIADFLNKIGIDKVLHFLVFGWVCSIGFTKSFTVGVWCFIGIFILSLVKEKYIDKKIDWVDVIAGFFGGWTAFALYWILNELL